MVRGRGDVPTTREKGFGDGTEEIPRPSCASGKPRAVCKSYSAVCARMLYTGVTQVKKKKKNTIIIISLVPRDASAMCARVHVFHYII